MPATAASLLHAWANGCEDREAARGAASLCLGCGACTRACVPGVPVAERARGWRRLLGDVAAAAPLGSVEGDARHVCVLGPGEDWAAAWSASRGLPCATLRSDDALGHAAWSADPDAAVEVRAALRGAFAGGRVAVVASSDIAEVLSDAGVEVERLPLAEGSGARFLTCFETPGPDGVPGQLACCGRREGFSVREPDAARDVALANVRALGDAIVACADEACAAWLRAHGARVEGPAAALAARERA